MKTKNLVSATASMCIIFSAYAAKPMLTTGDCITPTNRSYSWYGAFAKVEAVSAIEGLGPERRYILSFREYVSNSSIFSTEIDGHVKVVGRDVCSEKLK